MFSYQRLFEDKTLVNYDFPASQNVKLPQIVKGSYKTDLNIITIHDNIRNIFSYYRFHQKNILEKINDYLNPKEKYKSLEIAAKKREAIEMQKTLDKYDEKSWENYTKAIKPLFDKYLKITAFGKKQKIVFGESSPNKEDSSIIKERLHIIHDYLFIAKKYINIDLVHLPRIVVGCPDCNLTIEDMEINEDQGCYFCECGNWFDHVFSTETHHQDPDKIEGPKCVYEDKTNFIRRLNSYQGIQEHIVPQSLIDLLDNYFQRNGLPSAEEIRQMPVNNDGHRCEETSMKLLEDALKKTENTAYYKDMDLICHQLWGWVLPNISQIVPIILDDYSKTQVIYRKYHPNGSSINVNLRLYWHLRAAGYECSIDDFKIPSSTESLKMQSEIFKLMCQETGIKFYPII